MKCLILFLILFLSPKLFSDDDPKIKEKAKIYSQEDFEVKVEEEVIRRLAKLTGEQLEDYAKSLLKKEKQLEELRLDNEKKGKEIKMIEADLLSKLKKFRDQQSKIIGCIDDNEKEASTRVDHIVKVISGMKPLNAAEVLSVQDSEISVQILSKLDPTKISKIFNSMDKEISARLQKEYINMKR